MMTSDARSIFRREALRHFVEGKEKSVLPRFIRPRTFLCLWILLGLLLAAVGLAWSARVPVYTPGIAVVAEIDGQATLVVLVPTETAETLTIGQTVHVRWPAPRDQARTTLTHVEPSLSSPAAARRRYGLSSDMVTRPVAVATARIEDVFADEHPLVTQAGTVVPVEVEVGSCRAIALLPFIGEALR